MGAIVDRYRVPGCLFQSAQDFDSPKLESAVRHLTHEHYAVRARGARPASRLISALYYLVRPFLGVPLRSRIQRLYFRGWKDLPFPSWPVDVTADRLLEAGLLAEMNAAGIDSAPFIWFWPDGASAAAMMTHDVETAAGRDFCPRLMDLDESFDFRSAFQVVPERRYSVPPSFLNEIRVRGHEINVQDLNHDGKLFLNRGCFEARVRAINEYGRAWGARGFRSAILYRNLDWLDALEFDYDMSAPNVAHLEPQRGGCCTIFPYFAGRILELPLTATQDYSLFHILRDYTIDLWRAQSARVVERHGLLSFIVHPDYLAAQRARDTYKALLDHLARLRSDSDVWIALPRQIDQWWRQRSRMTVVRDRTGWRIEGPGNERARLAWAAVVGGRIVYARERREVPLGCPCDLPR